MKEHELQAWDGTFGYSLWGIKSLFYINAGAVAIILTLSGTIWSANEELAGVFLGTVMYFAGGAGLSVVLAFTSYACQYFYATTWAKNNQYEQYVKPYTNKLAEFKALLKEEGTKSERAKHAYQEAEELWDHINKSLKDLKVAGCIGKALHICSVLIALSSLAAFFYGLLDAREILLKYLEVTTAG